MRSFWMLKLSVLPLQQALAKTLTVSQLAYLKEQFTLLGPNRSGFISIQNFKTVSHLSLPLSLLLRGQVCFSLMSHSPTYVLSAGNYKALHRCNEDFTCFRICQRGKFFRNFPFWMFSIVSLIPLLMIFVWQILI